ncbi:MAG: single-stranded DNA-binding protein, partial [Chloroflexi bacterium]|nr:single-stranded DNA-binding protein [Chloroflexota bacterium]
RDGQKRTSLEITADSIVNLERRGRDDEGQFGGPAADGGAAGGGQSGEGRSGGGGQSGEGRSGGVRPGRPPTDDTELDDLPF